MSNQTRAARRKVLVKKPQEHYVRLQFMPKTDFFLFHLRHRKPQSQDLKIPFVISCIPEIKKYSFSVTWRSAWKDSNGFIADSC